MQQCQRLVDLVQDARSVQAGDAAQVADGAVVDEPVPGDADDLERDLPVGGIGQPRLLQHLQDRGAEPADRGPLLQRHHQALPARLVEDQLAVDRLEESGVDHAHGPAFRRQRVRHRDAARHDRPEADQQDLATVAQDLALSDGQHLRGPFGHPEAGIARVVERERVILGERGPHQRAELLLVLRCGDDEVRDLAVGRVGEHALVAGPVLADEARPVHADQDRLVVLGRVMDDLVEGPLEEGRIDRDHRPATAQGDPGRQRDRVLLRDADVHEPLRELRLEPVEAGPGGHSRRDRHDVAILAGRGDDLLGEVVRVVGLLGHAGLLRRGRHRPAVAGARPGRDRRDLAGSERAGRTAPASLMGVGHRRQRGAVEADLVPLRRTVAAPLLGPDVHEDRDVHGEGTTEGVLERP